MKEGWEYKKIGLLCDIKTGKLDANAASPNGKYPFFTCSREILKIDNYAYDCECILVAGNGELNAKYYKGKFNAYQRTYIITLKPNTNEISTKYLYCFFSKYIETLRQRSIGGVIKYIKLGDLTNAQIPVPDYSRQLIIVEELDLLSSIIEKKKAQLNELDNLAQSLFYEMFGDPITNDKGWEVRKLNDIYKLKSGDGLSAKNFVEGIYPVYGGNGISGYHNAYNMNGDFIIIGRVGAYCGNVRYVKGLFWLTDNAFQLFFDANIQTPVFVLYLLTLLDLHRFANEAAQPVISNKTLRDLDIIIPTMEMQNLFASKIETIEHQKELIRKSIKEVETLYNSRMDLWFNKI